MSEDVEDVSSVWIDDGQSVDFVLNQDLYCLKQGCIGSDRDEIFDTIEDFWKFKKKTYL